MRSGNNVEILEGNGREVRLLKRRECIERDINGRIEFDSFEVRVDVHG